MRGLQPLEHPCWAAPERPKLVLVLEGFGTFGTIPNRVTPAGVSGMPLHSGGCKAPLSKPP